MGVLLNVLEDAQALESLDGLAYEDGIIGLVGIDADLPADDLVLDAGVSANDDAADEEGGAGGDGEGEVDDAGNIGVGDIDLHVAVDVALVAVLVFDAA